MTDEAKVKYLIKRLRKAMNFNKRFTARFDEPLYLHLRETLENIGETVEPYDKERLPKKDPDDMLKKIAGTL